MKKLLPMLLAVAMLFSFAACGEKTESSGEINENETADAVVLDSPEAAVEAYYRSVIENDYDMYVKSLAPELIENFGDELNKNSFAQQHKEFVEEYGEDAEFEFEAIEINDISKEGYEEAAEVFYTIKINGKTMFDGDRGSDAVKVDGEWKYLSNFVRH